LADVRTTRRLETALREAQADGRAIVYSPVLTLGACRGPVISPVGSCRAAVARVLAWLVSQGQTPCTPETDPYGKARQRLPETPLPRLRPGLR
jgi:hypothetical protein